MSDSNSHGTAPMGDQGSQHPEAKRIEHLSNGDFLVIHPLDDTEEEKCETESLGYAPMTPMVRWSLIALRAYLIIMALMVFYRSLQLAKIIG